MLVNNNRRYYKAMACAQVVVVCLLLFNLSAFAYDAWQPDNESEAIQGLDEILEEFEILLTKARVSKAANPVFLSDLEEVLERLKNQSYIIAGDYGSNYVSFGCSEVESKEILGPEVTYLGQDDDKIGPWSILSPDGLNDGHFQVRMYFPREVEVKNLKLYKSNDRGEKLDSWWYSESSGAWVLGVFQNGRLLNPDRQDTLGSFSGRALLDIYAAVTGSCFDEGEYLLLEMTTSEGVVEGRARVILSMEDADLEDGDILVTTLMPRVDNERKPPKINRKR